MTLEIKTLGRFSHLPESPFVRLRALLDEDTPAKPPISLALGEPHHPAPDFVAAIMGANAQDYGRYPPIGGTDALRQAARDWCARRFALPAGWLDAETMILPLAGTREGLFLAPQLRADTKPNARIILPNPFYQTYAAAALAANAQPFYANATAATGFLPDLDAIPESVLAACIAFYICSPANPQGAVADRAYLATLLALARKHDFIILADECYADIYNDPQNPPPSLLEVAATEKGDAPILVFHSLSKRSNLAGLRAGFCAGGQELIVQFARLRAVVAPQMPLPAQRVAAQAWQDDNCAAKNRQAYQAKFDLAEEVFGTDFGFYRPQGGFFLWLDVGALTDGTRDASEVAAQILWREEALRVLPGLYLGHTNAEGINPGSGYIRVALVADSETTRDALTRLHSCLHRTTRTITKGRKTA